MKNMRESLIAWALTLGLLALFAAAAIGGTYLVNRAKCDSKSERMGMQRSYGLLQGCMVRAPRGWVPLENVRDIE